MKFITRFIPLFISLLISLLLISGCSMVQHQTKLDWPADLPPITHYISSYNEDPSNTQLISLDEYLLWIKRIYLGWELYRRGWIELSNNLAETIVDNTDRDLAEAKLAFMGKLVSTEWAKHRRLSTIKTRHLLIWGNALDQSPEKNEQLEIIDKVLADANLLIQRQLTPKDILIDRYYPQAVFHDREDPFK
jgi:hypothetical protein